MLKPRNSNNFMFMLFSVSVLLIPMVAFTVSRLRMADPNFEIDLPIWALLLVGQLLAFGLPCAIYLMVRRDKIKEFLPMRRLGWRNVIMITGMALSIQPVFMLLNVLSQFIFPNVIAEVIMGIGRQDGLAMALIIIAIVPSIFEEVAFRGIGFAGFKHVSIRKAALINGLLFGFIHMNMNQFLYAFVLGAVFCYFMYYTKSLWAPILAHFVFNATQSLLAYVVISTMDYEAMEAAAAVEAEPFAMVAFLLIMSVIALAFAAGFIAIFIAFRRHNIKRNEEEGIVTDTAAAFKAEGGEPPRAFTWAFWAAAISFAILMAMNYLGPVFEESLEVMGGL